jgi:glycosyltransferase involved in cell wall biosynthesis
MRIAYLATIYYFPSETFIRDLAQGLAQRGHRVTVFCSQMTFEARPANNLEIKQVSFVRPIALVGKLISKAIQVFGYDSDATSGNSQIQYAIRRLMPAIAEFAPELIYADYGMNGIYAVEIARVLKVPLVVHFHGFDASTQFHSQFYRRKIEGLLEYAARIIVPSEHVKRLLVIACGRLGRIEVIPYGPDLGRVSRHRNVQRTIHPSLICLGRLVGKKNPLATVEAFVLVKTSFPEAKLTIIGEGPQRDALASRIRAYGLSDSVKLLGAMKHDEALAIMAQHWVFLQHSVTSLNGDQEGLPVSILEACALGLPVVSTIHSGIPEAIENGVNGYLVREHHYVSMAERVCRLLQDADLRSRMGQEGRKLVEQRFNLDARLCKINALMEECQSAGMETKGMKNLLENEISAPKKSTVRSVVARFRGLRFRIEEVFSGFPEPGRSTEKYALAAIEWLLRAQAATSDNGVASGYNAVLKRWGSSYPETTGYIISSLLRVARAGIGDQAELRLAVIRMGSWLLTTQLECGAFPGGDIEVATRSQRPTVFNTGQILKGLTDLVSEGLDADGRFALAAKRASDWLCEVQDDNGAWYTGRSPLTTGDVHSYDVRTAWALVRYGKKVGDAAAVEAGLRNAEWLCSQCDAEGWFPHMSFHPEQTPVTHTVAYTIQGLLEIGVLMGRSDFAEKACQAAAKVLSLQCPKTGAIPGQIAPGYRSAVKWTSATGNAQMAIIWFRLAEIKGEPSWRKAAERINRFNCSLQELDLESRDPGRRGALRGSYPGHLGYGRFWYMNWTQKFHLDALLAQTGASII